MYYHYNYTYNKTNFIINYSLAYYFKSFQSKITVKNNSVQLLQHGVLRNLQKQRP